MDDVKYSISPRGAAYALFDASKRPIVNWHGQKIPPAARDAVSKGNEVRVQIFGPNPTPQTEGYCVTMYFRVVEIHADSRLEGVCDDPYYGEDPRFPFNDGDLLVFERKNIVEIPTDWETNLSLAHFKPISALCQFPTGPVAENQDLFELLNIDIPVLDSLSVIEEVARNRDYAVRWLLLDFLSQESPAEERDRQRWIEVDKIIKGFENDSYPMLREYAQYLQKDRMLNLAIWHMHGTNKADQQYKALKREMKLHRRMPFSTFCDAIDDFKVEGLDNLRAALDHYILKYLAGR